VASGRMPGGRLEEAASRVAELRAWTAGSGPAGSGEAGSEEVGSEEVGLAAARRAVRVDGVPQPLRQPLVVEIVPPANMAAGPVPWGLGSFVPAGSLRRVSTGKSPAALARSIEGLLAEAAGRSLVVVVRDAHRYPAAAGVAAALLTARPDAVVVEMGLPVWHPPAGVYLATFGAARTSSRAAAEVLGLA
jgi:beta-N-acetylhexosaminidase